MPKTLSTLHIRSCIGLHAFYALLVQFCLSRTLHQNKFTSFSELLQYTWSQPLIMFSFFFSEWRSQPAPNRSVHFAPAEQKHEWITRDGFGYVSERSLLSTGRVTGHVTFQRRENPRDEARELWRHHIVSDLYTIFRILRHAFTTNNYTQTSSVTQLPEITRAC